MPDSPERTLLAAVLEQAALDARHPSEQIRAGAWLWLREPDHLAHPDSSHGFSFPFICAVLQISPAWALRRIREQAARVLAEETRETPKKRFRPRVMGRYQYGPRERVTVRR